LPIEAVAWDRISAPVRDRIRASLSEEFSREWAPVLDDARPGWERDYLARTVRDAEALGAKLGVPMVWAFRYGRPGHPVADDPVWEWASAAPKLPAYPVGLAAVREAADGGAGDGR